MFILSQAKLYELEKEQNQEFLNDLVYEIIKENPALKLNGYFSELLEPVQNLMNRYLEKGVNQINTLKYMVKSHIYLGIDYENDLQYSWLKSDMEYYNIEEQVTYVDAFYEILEDYKKRVIGENFEFMIRAINQLKRDFSNLNTQEIFSMLYPEKAEFLRNKDAFISFSENQLKDVDVSKKFVLGSNFNNNFFIKNIQSLEF